MTASISQLALYLLAALAVGGGIGWLIRGANDKRRFETVNNEWLVKFDEAARQRDRFNAENTKLRTSIEAQQAVVHKHELAASKIRTELESAAERIKALTKDAFTASSERDEYKAKVNANHDALLAAKRQITDLESEFIKAGNFYKGELEKNFDRRKTLEVKLDDAKAELASLTNLLTESKSENESINKMLTAAQMRLDNLDALERKAIELEAENAQLRHDASGTRLEIESLQRDVAELEELKVQNKELAHCLRSMENSRRQYEIDAKRYREQADQSEQRSETLRMKLDNVEQSFAKMAKQDEVAKKVVAKVEAPARKNGTALDAADLEIDDLTAIVGIGKVFAQTLQSLGICSYRQIANFGPADIARVNMELKEFRGRMEQDDWVGQAKELYFKKYGNAASH